MSLLQYDPEYTYKEQMDVDQEEEEDGWGDEYGEEAEAQAVEDSSRLVRISAVKLIDVLAASFKSKHAELVTEFALPLSVRLIERSEKCKVEIFQALRTLLGSSWDS